MIIRLTAWCVCSGSRAPGSITTSSTRTRSFSRRRRCEAGAASSASMVSGHGHGCGVVMFGSLPGQGGLDVGPAVGLGGEQADDEREAHVVVSPYLVQEGLVCSDDDVKALERVGGDCPRHAASPGPAAGIRRRDAESDRGRAPAVTIAVDTNVLVRYLTWDDERQALAAAAILEGDEAIAVANIVLCELTWVLGRAYRYPSEEIDAAISRVVASRNVVADRD